MRFSQELTSKINETRKFATLIFFYKYGASEPDKTLEHVMTMLKPNIEGISPEELLRKIQEDEEMCQELKGKGILPNTIKIHRLSFSQALMPKLVTLHISPDIPLPTLAPEGAKAHDFVLITYPGQEDDLGMLFYMLDDHMALALSASKPPSEESEELEESEEPEAVPDGLPVRATRH